MKQITTLPRKIENKVLLGGIDIEKKILRDKKGRFLKGIYQGNGFKSGHLDYNLEQKGRFKKGYVPWIKGNHHSEETKRKISLSHKGMKFSEEHKLNLRKPRSEVVRLKMSKAHKGKKLSEKTKENIGIGLKRAYKECKRRRYHTEETKIKLRKYVGEKASNWKGGISFEPYGIAFNNQLKAYIRWMDNFTCQQCGIPEAELGYQLHIHHIDFNKKNNIIQNLISLCNTCHGQTNFNRQDWINYFQDKLSSGSRK